MRLPASFDFARRREMAARSRTSTQVLTRVFRGLGWLVLLGVTAWCYVPALSGELVWEDATRIGLPPPARGPAYRDVIRYEQVLGTGPERYRPLTELSLHWDLARGGRPFDFHFMSLFLHLVNVLLLYAVARRLRLGRGASWFAALLFGVYPLCNMAVAHVGAREELLAMTFMLLAFLFHTSEGWLHVPFAVLFFTLGLLARPAAAGAGLILIAWEVGRHSAREAGRSVKQALAKFVPYVIIGAVMLVAVRRHFGTVGFLAGGEGNPRRLLLTLPVAFYRVVQLILRPYANAQPSMLTFRTQNVVPWVRSWSDPSLLVGLVFVLGYAAAVWLTVRGRGRALVPLVALAALWLPLDSIFFGRAFDLTHNLYAPSAAFAILLALVVERAGFEGRAGQVRRGVVGGAAVVVVLSFMVATQSRIAVWHDEVNVYMEALSHYPSVSALHAGYGTALARRGDELAAVDELRRSEELDPVQPVYHYNLGLVFMQLGRYGEAATEFRHTVELDARDAEAWYRWGLAEVHEGNAADALTATARATSLDPNRADFHVGAAAARLLHGDATEAEGEARRAIDLEPRGAEGYAMLAAVMREAGRLEEALRAGENAVTLDASSPEAALEYARALAAGGRTAEALEQLGRYVTLERHPEKSALELQARLKGKMGT